MLLRLDLAVAASPKLRPAVRQLVPALLGPQVNNFKILFNMIIITVFTWVNMRSLSQFFKVEELGPDLVEVGGGQVDGEAAVRGVEHLHLS